MTENEIGWMALLNYGCESGVNSGAEDRDCVLQSIMYKESDMNLNE